MARALNRLSARFVATTMDGGRHADGGGLYLSVGADGKRRRWVFLYKLHGKQREMGLGAAPAVTLADARRAADQARKQLNEGLDPLHARRQLVALAPTFGETADRYIDAMAAGWRNPKHLAQWKMTLSRTRDDNGFVQECGYCLSIRDRRVDQIDTEAILGVLKPIWTTKPETANRLRGRIEAILDSAKAEGHRDGPNPAIWKGHLALLLSKQNKLARGHHPAMPFAELPVFVGKLRLARGMGCFALEFLILTAARSGEVRLARWQEIDFEAKAWTVPADRMKAGREHRIPLSDRAIEILHTVAPLRPVNNASVALIFPSARREKALSDMTLGAVLRRLDARDFTVHGFRSSFRDWAGDKTDFSRELAEAALAHTVGNATEAAYRRSDAFDKRRKLMDAWAGFVTSHLEDLVSR